MKYFLIGSLLLSLSMISQANAIPLSLSVTDATLDQFGVAPDLSGMLFIFDNETGNYEITLQTTEANPFLNNIRININLLNITLDSTSASALFQDNAQDFNLTSSTTELTLSGHNSRLLDWKADDNILLNNFPTGQPHPNGATFFRSGVLGDGWSENNAPFTNEDMLGLTSEIAVIVDHSAPVPEPASILLLGFGISGLLGYRKKLKQ